MRLFIALEGRPKEVLVEGVPPDLRVTVEDRPLALRVVVRDTVARAEIDGRTVVLEFGSGVRIDGVPRKVRVHWVAEDSSPEGDSSDVVDVLPPMPGRIIRVLVAPGDSVRRGTPLVVLEAMKMHNEVPAPVSGTVQVVRVREGDAVAASEPLVRLARAGSTQDASSA